MKSEYGRITLLRLLLFGSLHLQDRQQRVVGMRLGTQDRGARAMRSIPWEKERHD